MKLQYVGNDNEDPVKVKIYGYEFDLNGEAVEIKEEKIAKKLSGNPTFKVLVPVKAEVVSAKVDRPAKRGKK